MRFTVDQYCQEFGLNKDVVLFKLKTGQLNYIIEDSTTYIIVTKSSLNKEQRDNLNKHNNNTKMPSNSAKTTVRFILSLYKQENQLLKDKIKQLELKIDELVAQKEQMLCDERDRIEQLYIAKDNQLKQILELVNTKLLQNQSQQIPQEDVINVSLQSPSTLTELKEYLKSMDISSSHKKRIKKRFIQFADEDIRIIQQNGKIYMDFAKYDYTDLLKI